MTNIQIGANSLQDCKHGDIQINSIQKGSVLYWQKDPTIIYGWHVNPNESNPDDAITYLNDAINKSPVSMGSTTFDYGDWENAFFMPKPCMLNYDGTVAYYLDPNDYTKKADGTASDVANASFGGNAMMEWPKIWYKFETGSTSGEGNFYCSNQQVDDTYHCWCNYDYNNNQIDHFYTAIYNGTIDANNKLRSISNLQINSTNKANTQTYATFLNAAYANNNSQEWLIDQHSDWQLISALLVLMGKSLETQAIFGVGRSVGNEAAQAQSYTGDMNDKGLFYGSSDNSKPVKVFGMENRWGLVYRFLAGAVMPQGSNTLRVKNTVGTADGSNQTGYSITNTDNYINTGINLPLLTNNNNNGFIKKMSFTNYGIYPIEIQGSGTTYYADRLAHYYNNSGVQCYLISSIINQAYDNVYGRGGTFNLEETIATSATWTIGASLSCKPAYVPPTP